MVNFSTFTEQDVTLHMRSGNIIFTRYIYSLTDLGITMNVIAANNSNS